MSRELNIRRIKKELAEDTAQRLTDAATLRHERRATDSRPIVPPHERVILGRQTVTALVPKNFSRRVSKLGHGRGLSVSVNPHAEQLPYVGANVLYPNGREIKRPTAGRLLNRIKDLALRDEVFADMIRARVMPIEDVSLIPGSRNPAKAMLRMTLGDPEGKLSEEYRRLRKVCGVATSRDGDHHWFDLATVDGKPGVLKDPGVRREVIDCLDLESSVAVNRLSLLWPQTSPMAARERDGFAGLDLRWISDILGVHQAAGTSLSDSH
jgi:hypothetical protein